MREQIGIRSDDGVIFDSDGEEVKVSEDPHAEKEMLRSTRPGGYGELLAWLRQWLKER